MVFRRLDDLKKIEMSGVVSSSDSCTYFIFSKWIVCIDISLDCLCWEVTFMLSC